jgi:hypothetical protein
MNWLTGWFPDAHLAIPTKPNSNPQASRTRFRREAEQQSERSDAGILIVGQVFGFGKRPVSTV